MMKCTNCRQDVPDEARVCGYCGHRLKSTPVVEPVDLQPTRPVSTTPASQPVKAPIPVPPAKKKRRWWLILVFAALGMCFFAAIVLVLTYLFVPSINLPFYIQF